MRFENFQFRFLDFIDLEMTQRSGGVLASTWVLKLKEHVGALEVLVKNEQIVIGNNYALAA